MYAIHEPPSPWTVYTDIRVHIRIYSKILYEPRLIEYIHMPIDRIEYIRLIQPVPISACLSTWSLMWTSLIHLGVLTLYLHIHLDVLTLYLHMECKGFKLSNIVARLATHVCTSNTYLHTQHISTHATYIFTRNRYLQLQHVSTAATRIYSCNTQLRSQHISTHTAIR